MKCVSAPLLFIVAMATVADCAEELESPEANAVLALAQKLSRTSPAYELTARRLMVEEAIFFRRALRLPVSESTLTVGGPRIHVTPPWFSRTDNPDATLSPVDRVKQGQFFAAGRIEAGKFVFAFNKGRLTSLQRVQIGVEKDIFELYPEWFKAQSLLDTNSAYALASNWLASVSVDVARLERRMHPEISQWQFNGRPEEFPPPGDAPSVAMPTNITLLPVFNVQWGAGEGFAAKVVALGTTRELLTLEIRDGSYSSRPGLAIVNAFELNQSQGPRAKRLQPPPK